MVCRIEEKKERNRKELVKWRRELRGKGVQENLMRKRCGDIGNMGIPSKHICLNSPSVGNLATHTRAHTKLELE